MLKTVSEKNDSNPNERTSGSLPNMDTLTSFINRILGRNSCGKTTKRTLSEEAECGSPESLSDWLKKGADVNEVDPYGYTPLVNASLR